MKSIGIEKVRVYPTSLKLNLNSLAEKRGFDTKYLHKELMAYERGLNPPWEDPVTMAVNAARPMLTEEDRQSIGLLIVGTETGLDQEKSLSSWALNYLNLPAACRHFEVKAACYSGTAALKMAASWLASGMAKPGQKALVITTDQSLDLRNKEGEFVSGAGAVALLISSQPDFLALEFNKFGIYASEVADVIRPLPWVETGSSDTSLFSYTEGLLGAYEDYVANVGVIDFDNYFQYNVYHVPFSGISYFAHKQLLKLNNITDKEVISKSFAQRTLPSIQYTKRIGGTYGGSTFITLLGLIQHAENIKAGDRVGIFSYGSGFCAEYYSAIIGNKAKEVATEAGLKKLLEERFSVTIEAYEQLENSRNLMSREADYMPDFNVIPDLYEAMYKDKGLLVYKGSKNYIRNYEFS